MGANKRSGQKGIKCLWYSYTFIAVVHSSFFTA